MLRLVPRSWMSGANKFKLHKQILPSVQTWCRRWSSTVSLRRS